MEAFIETIYRIFLLANRKAEMQQDKRLKFICLAIFNYVRDLAKEHEVDLRTITFDPANTTVNLVPFFAYIEKNEVQLLNLQTATINSINVGNKKDLERYVLSQVYYLTQSTQTTTTA